ncbi:Pressure-regulated protein [Pseudomonas caricapapayae]|uniref:Pressure-regulated protein n=1 Tax=Pseudomonas caricapapayae TaxID=46678 RepID=A0A3M3BBD1_9PSED|nr:Pressure-regulated protein [Pseudomonas caricapapayae]RMV95874.1 Pressure-regulated protein [Pseudomonas caricapapayae]
MLDPIKRQQMTGQAFRCGWCANAADNDSLAAEKSR